MRFDNPLGELLKTMMRLSTPASEQFARGLSLHEELRVAAREFVDSWDAGDVEAISFNLIRLREAIVAAAPQVVED